MDIGNPFSRSLPMRPFLLTLIAVVATLAFAFAAPTAGIAENAGPEGPAPRFFTVLGFFENGKGFEMHEQVRRDPGDDLAARIHSVRFTDVELFDAAGKEITEKEFRKRVRVGSVVLVSADQKRVDPAYLRVVREDTVVVVGPLVKKPR